MHAKDSLAERSKAVAQGAIPKGRGFEPHSCHWVFQGALPMHSIARLCLRATDVIALAQHHRWGPPPSARRKGRPGLWPHARDARGPRPKPCDGASRMPRTVWPSGLRQWLKAPFRKGVGSNPTAVTGRGPVALQAQSCVCVCVCERESEAVCVMVLWKWHTVLCCLTL